MSPPRWKPSVTVAAIVEDGGRYLLVEEHTPEGLKLNNPAGHLDPGESPLQAVVREALEETARVFTPTALLGVYLSRFVRPAQGATAAEDVTFLRFAYCGSVGEVLPGRALDTGIVRTLWLAALRGRPPCRPPLRARRGVRRRQRAQPRAQALTRLLMLIKLAARPATTAAAR